MTLQATGTEIDGTHVPALLYGTAWKEERTEALVTQALDLGFRGIDTANQRVHYYEAGVGAALKTAMDNGLKRSEFFLQTKFTYAAGQDKRLPFDPSADTATQVRQSVKSSLEHLHTDYLDSFVIHGPEGRDGLTDNDMTVWRTMEELHHDGFLKLIGVSNFSHKHLSQLLQAAKVRPRFVQNRCLPSWAWDINTRELCEENGILYQGFNLLRDAIVENSPALKEIAKRHERTIQQIIYRWALNAGMLPMTGATSPEHLKEAMAIFNFELDAEECDAIQHLK